MNADAAQVRLGDALRRATADLHRAGIEGAGNDARRLLSAALGWSAAQVLARPERPLSAAQIESFGREVIPQAQGMAAKGGWKATL